MQVTREKCVCIHREGECACVCVCVCVDCLLLPHLASICVLISSGVRRVPDATHGCLSMSWREQRSEGTRTKIRLKRSHSSKEKRARRSAHSLQN